MKETPQFARATSFASMDSPGPFEKKATEAYYYVTPTEKDWTEQQKEEWLTAFNYYTTDLVSIHEVYPGITRNSSASTPRTRPGPRRSSAATLSWKVGRTIPKRW